MQWKGVGLLFLVAFGVPGVSQAAEQPLALPHRPAAERRAVQAEFDAKHLEIRQITSHYSMGYGGYGGWPGYGWPIYRYRTVREAYWTVVKGQQHLDSSDFFTLIERPDLSDTVAKRIEKNRIAASTLYGTGAVGAIGLLIGANQMDLATTTDQYSRGAALSTVGAGLLLGGIFSASFPHTRVRELRYQVGQSIPYDDAAAAVFTYNEKLRREIGMSPSEARHVDSWAPGTP